MSDGIGHRNETAVGVTDKNEFIEAQGAPQIFEVVHKVGDRLGVGGIDFLRAPDVARIKANHPKAFQ